MANITKEQVLKINGKCANDFVLDLRHFAFHGDKQLYKYISLGNERVLEVELYFSERWDRESRKKNNVPSIHFSEWKTDGQMMASSGIGYFKEIDNPIARKNTNILIDLTKRYDNETCMKMYEEEKNSKVNMFA